MWEQSKCTETNLTESCFVRLVAFISLRPIGQLLLRHFGLWDMPVICLTVVSKFAVMVFVSLYFQTFWPNWLNFFCHFKNICGRKKNSPFVLRPNCGTGQTNYFRFQYVLFSSVWFVDLRSRFNDDLFIIDRETQFLTNCAFTAREKNNVTSSHFSTPPPAFQHPPLANLAQSFEIIEFLRWPVIHRKQ